MGRAGKTVARLALTAALLTIAAAAPAKAAPGAFSLVSPASDGWVDAAPTFTWNPAPSAGSPVDSYWLVLDDNGAAAIEVDAATCTSVCSARVPGTLAGGRHTWYVAALDADDGEIDSEERAFAVDVTAPAAPTITGVTWTSPAGQTPEVSVTWTPSTDAGAGVTTYEVGLNPFGSISAPNGFPSAPLTTQTTTAILPAGATSSVITQRVGVRAVDAVGFRSSIATARYEVATLTVADRYAVGTKAKVSVLLPSLSVGPVSTAWDLDGDGTFETPDPRNVAGVVAHSFTPARPGTYAIGVRSTQGIYTAVLSRAITVDPPTGSAVIRLLSAVRWNTSRSVPLVLDYPSDTTAAAIAIGSAKPRRAKLGHDLVFHLPKAVRDGKVKLTVTYTGFQRTTTASVTIRVDTTRPTISAAKLSNGRLAVRASDKTSGLKSIQLATTSRSKPAKARPYTSSLKVSRATWVRVIDRAGNASAWKRIARSR